MSGNGRLRREIEALLRWRVRGDVLDRLRGPVLGIRTSAIPLLPGGFVPTPFGVIDHGWMQYTAPTLPPSIYADSTLAGYLAGSGTLIPGGGGDSEQLIGPMATDAGRSCQSGYDGITWTTPPTLDIDLKYASHSWAATAPAISDAVPHRHSGLGVAFAQALLGVGRKFSDVLPAGWTYDPTKIALVRGPDRAYWLAKIDSAGCFLTRLNLPAAYYCVDYWLANDLLTGYAAGLAEAIVLGNLTLPESPTIYEALSASGIAGVYADSAIDMPGWGWQWTTQRHGESDEVAAKAILVTIYPINPTNYLTRREVSRTCRLTLNWSANVPTTATLSISTSGAWRLNEFYLKVFCLNAEETVLSRWDPLGGITFVTLTEEGIFAAWYGANATEIIAKWSGVDTAADDIYTNPSAVVCGLGTVIRGSYTYWTSGKDVTLSVGANTMKYKRAAAPSTNVYTYTSGDSGITNEIPGNQGQKNCANQIIYCENNEDGDVWTQNQMSHGPGASTYAKLAAKSYGNCSGGFVIAFGPPRTIFARQRLINGTGGTWQDTYQYANAVGGWHASHTKGCDFDTWNSYDYIWFWVDDTARTQSGSLSPGEVVSSEAAVFIEQDKIIMSDDISWWDTLWALGGAGTTSQVPLAITSRGGLKAYMDAPGASPTWEMPVSLAAPAGDVRGWVGGV